jgi:hypothetical protein
MEVEISEAEKTKCDRVFFFLVFLWGFQAVRPFRIVFSGGVFLAPPGRATVCLDPPLCYFLKMEGLHGFQFVFMTI